MQLALVGPYPAGVYEQICSLLPRWKVTRIDTQQELDTRTDLEFVILRTFKMDAALIAANPRLRMIQRWGAGFDTVDIAAAGERGIPVAVAAGINSHAVAEHTILLILAALRNLVPLATDTAAGGWDRNTYAGRTYMLAEKQVGLVGCGAIGRYVAQLLKGLGASVSYYDAFRLDQRTEEALGLTYLELDGLFLQSDIVSLHLPMMEETKGMIDRKLLGRMKPTAVLVNTSRGGLVDEEALAEALREGKLLGAALDSVSQEPYPPNGCLRKAPNLIITPHVAGTVVELNLHMARRVCDNVLAVYENRPLSQRELVNSATCDYPTI